MSVCCECCVLWGRGLCDWLITRPEASYRLWCVVVCDLGTSIMNRPWPALGFSATRKKNTYENWTGYPIIADIRTSYIASIISLTSKRAAQFVIYCTSAVFDMPTGIQVVQITWLKVSASCILYLLVFTLWSLCVTSMICADNHNRTLCGDIVLWMLFFRKMGNKTWS